MCLTCLTTEHTVNTFPSVLLSLHPFFLSTDTSACPLQAQRQTAHQGDEEEDDEGDERMAPFTLPVVVLVVLVIFVLMIIIFLQVRAL